MARIPRPWSPDTALRTLRRLRRQARVGRVPGAVERFSDVLEDCLARLATKSEATFRKALERVVSDAARGARLSSQQRGLIRARTAEIVESLKPLVHEAAVGDAIAGRITIVVPGRPWRSVVSLKPLVHEAAVGDAIVELWTGRITAANPVLRRHRTLVKRLSAAEARVRNSWAQRRRRRGGLTIGESILEHGELHLLSMQKQVLDERDEAVALLVERDARFGSQITDVLRRLAGMGLAPVFLARLITELARLPATRWPPLKTHNAIKKLVQRQRAHRPR